MRNIRGVVAGLAVLVLLAGCSLPRGAAIQSEILSEETRETPSFQLVQITRDMTPVLAKWPVTGWHGRYHWFGTSRGPDSSVIRTGDAVDIVIWDSQDNSLLNAAGSKSTVIPTMQVSSSGTIFMPYVGEVPIRGMTASSARKRLQDRLEPIAPSAQVQISVTPGRNNAVDLISGMSAPGRYTLENRDTKILSIIAQGGGISSGLRNPLVRLQRGGNSYETRFSSLLAEPARNVRLLGGDQISVVEDDRSFNVLGAAGSQQVMYFEKEQMTAMEALSAMGGLESSRANPKGVLILREYKASDLKPGNAGPDMQQVVFSIDLTSADGLFAARQFEINPNDTLLATESPIRSVQTVFGLIGSLIGLTAQTNNL